MYNKITFKACTHVNAAKKHIPVSQSHTDHYCPQNYNAKPALSTNLCFSWHISFLDGI